MNRQTRVAPKPWSGLAAFTNKCRGHARDLIGATASDAAGLDPTAGALDEHRNLRGDLLAPGEGLDQRGRGLVHVRRGDLALGFEPSDQRVEVRGRVRLYLALAMTERGDGTFAPFAPSLRAASFGPFELGFELARRLALTPWRSASTRAIRADSRAAPASRSSRSI